MFESSWPQMFAVVASGELAPSLNERIKTFEKVIAVDGGLRYIKDRAPIAIVGDFDSVKPEDLARFPHVHHDIHPQDKDKSDTELAIDYAFGLGAERVVLFAAIGGWIDHVLANLFLLIKHPHKLSIETESQTLYAICDSKKEVSWPGRRISFFPLGERVKGVATTGLRWNIHGRDLDSSFYSLSNEAVGDTFEIVVGSGTLICILQNG